ncbi:glycoside hydrolase family 15 protein [Marichromatium sp. AB32]|uniref:glycoside hydrolase family 15 protein n=1 Tax=Marichromatium sp. AB32 TaxID=2483363 RepID=UPI000F3AE432|nr:glycoside hydrolase family 15 protein [Marichromatium sp. AB32]RNE89449.1 phosphorylase kinase [Marichromatium sp. AB32]
MLFVQNERLLDLMKSEYKLADINNLLAFCGKNRIFEFSTLDNGLFPAARTNSQTDYTGYSSVWVRDNIHIAHAHYVCGNAQVAVKNVSALQAYFNKHRGRFENIVSGASDSRNPMNRPHVRFNGQNMEEIDEKWAHAQNDALGYFLWFYCRLALDNLLSPSTSDLELLTLFPRYWQSIRFWEDEDSGHWEENRKISASSIGVVIAALKEMQRYLLRIGSLEYSALIDKLITIGSKKLAEILPCECAQVAPGKYRRYDSALLFLIFPLDILDEEMANTVLRDVINNLQGDHGIRRYLGDSYWSADYKKKVAPESRTIDFSDDIGKRNALLREGEEAQWCIFDPIISAIYALKFKHHSRNIDLENQIHYFNRSLGQITGRECALGEFLCPESYYLENDQYVPSDPTPLNWTQANLMMAIKLLEKNLCKKPCLFK